MGHKPSVPKPVKLNVGQSINDYVSGMNQALPGILAGEKQYTPQFTANNLSNYSNYLNGIGGSQGLISQTGAAQQASQSQITGLRSQNLSDMYGQTGQVRGLLQGLSPEQANAIQNSQDIANYYQSRLGGLNQEQQRNADQQALAMSQQRGRVNDNSSMSAQILNRQAAQDRNAGLASEYGNRAYTQAGNFYGGQGLELLGQTPASYTGGKQYVTQAQGLSGTSSPQLYNVGQGLQLGQQATANQNAYNNAVYQQKLQNYQSGMGMLGTLGGVGLGLATGGLGFGLTGTELLGAGALGGGLGGSFAGSAGSGGLINAGFKGLGAY